MDTVRQTEEARVRQNSSERDAERDREAERPRREQSDRRKHRGTGTVICGEGSRDTHRRRETEKLRDRHTVRCMDTSHTGLRPTFIMTQSHSAVLRVRASTYECEGTQFSP